MINKTISYITDITRQAIINHAQECYPQESCGLVVFGSGYVPCTNIASNPCEDFMIGINEWQPNIGIVHSHPNGELFLSGADRQQQIATDVSWFLVVDDDIIEYPCLPSLKGRTFDYGTSDCCSLVVDAYRLANIELIDAIRLGIDADIHEQTIIKSFKRTGFYQVHYETLSIGDIVLTRYDADPSKASHAGMYLGNEQIFHHEIGKLSHVTTLAKFTGNDDNYVHSVWRHHEWQDNSIMAIYNDLKTV